MRVKVRVSEGEGRWMSEGEGRWMSEGEGM